MVLILIVFGLLFAKPHPTDKIVYGDCRKQTNGEWKDKAHTKEKSYARNEPTSRGDNMVILHWILFAYQPMANKEYNALNPFSQKPRGNENSDNRYGYR